MAVVADNGELIFDPIDGPGNSVVSASNPNLRSTPGNGGGGGSAAPAAQAAAPSAPSGAASPDPTFGPARGTQAQRDANAIIQDQLQQWGLTGLEGWAWDRITQGASATQVAIEVKQTPRWKQEYGAVVDHLAAKGDYVTAGDILNYRNTVQQLAQGAGLPAGFVTQAEADTLMMGQVGATELAARIKAAQTAQYNASPETKAVMDQLYAMGATPGDITAHFLDPSRALPLLEQNYAASQIGGVAQRAGFSAAGIGTGALNRLAAQGVTQSQAQTGFGALQHEQEILKPLVGEQVHSNIALPDAILSQFGDDPQAAQLIEERRQSRLAQFNEGGDAGNLGATGLAIFAGR